MLGNVERYNNIINYERTTKEVSTRSRTKARNAKQNPQIENGANKKNMISEFIKNNIVALGVGVLVLVVWWIIHDLPESIAELKENSAVTSARLDSLEGNYTTLNSQVWSMNRASINNAYISEESEPVILLASTELSAGMLNSQTHNEYKEKVIINMPIIEDTAVLGENIETQEEETKKDIENTPFITYYTDNGEDVFFYGKYNENSQWDGKCIINSYKDSKLTFIMEAEYDNGDLKSYKQVFRGENSYKQEIWYVSNRTVEGKENSGQTTTYFFYGDCEKNFDIETIEEKDILSVEKFLKTIPSTIEGYYNGYTSGGRYNDSDGDAYLIKYKPNGNVRFLYVGKIENGYPKDDSGNAWSISWGYADDGYYYYKGTFDKGEHGKAPKNWKPMTKEEIKGKVNSDYFNCPLTGLL